MPRPRLTVYAVPGHSVPFRDEAGRVHVNVFVARNRDGSPMANGVEVEETAFITDQIREGALSLTPTE